MSSNHDTLRHPYSNYTVADALRLAKSFDPSLDEGNPEAARECIREVFDRTTHVWLTGMVALDVLDALIDGKDLRIHCRMIG